MSDRCKKQVRTAGTMMQWHQCKRPAELDGFCKQHHPDAVQRRRNESLERYQRNAANDPLRIAWAEIERLRARVAKLEVAVIGERERCAELCEKYADDAYDMDREIAAKELAAAIRSDGHLDNQKTSE